MSDDPIELQTIFAPHRLGDSSRAWGIYHLTTREPMGTVWAPTRQQAKRAVAKRLGLWAEVNKQPDPWSYEAEMAARVAFAATLTPESPAP